MVDAAAGCNHGDGTGLQFRHAGHEAGAQVAVRHEKAGRVRAEQSDAGLPDSRLHLVGEFDTGPAGFGETTGADQCGFDTVRRTVAEGLRGGGGRYAKHRQIRAAGDGCRGFGDAGVHAVFAAAVDEFNGSRVGGQRLRHDSAKLLRAGRGAHHDDAAWCEERSEVMHWLPPCFRLRQRLYGRRGPR